MGEVTGGRLEIKTSGRYTYEMGRALAASKDPADHALWQDWYRFTLELALLGSFSPDPTEQKMARIFVTDALEKSGRPTAVFASPADTRRALEALPASPEHMFWFEYNFLYVLAAGGRAEKAALGDHTPAGYRAARPLLRHQRRGEAQLLEGRRPVHRLPGRNDGPGAGRGLRRGAGEARWLPETWRAARGHRRVGLLGALF